MAKLENIGLVLSRKRGEKIIIGDGEDKIVLTVADIRGDKVRIGILAAKELPVHREEVYEDIKQHGKAK